MIQTNSFYAGEGIYQYMITILEYDITWQPHNTIKAQSDRNIYLSIAVVL